MTDKKDKLYNFASNSNKSPSNHGQQVQKAASMLGSKSKGKKGSGSNSYYAINPTNGLSINLGGNKNSSYLDKESHYLMGSAGLGAILGMSAELFKLRRKILNKWEREKQKARMEGNPEPPRPDTSRGALMAILKGAGMGAITGGVVGQLPVIGKASNDIAASIHGSVNKAISGSRLLSGDNFSQKVYKQGTGSVLLNVPYDEYHTYVTQGTDNFELPLSALKLGKKQSGSKQTGYDKKDKALLGKSGGALPIFAGLGGGGFAAYKAYKRDMELWERLKVENAKKGFPPPTKPVLGDYIGEFVKGGLGGVVAGSVLSATGVGKSLNSQLGDKYDYIDRKKGNDAVWEIRKAHANTGKLKVGRFGAKYHQNVNP